MDSDTNPDLKISDSDDELLAECRVQTFRAGGPGGTIVAVASGGNIDLARFARIVDACPPRIDM